MWCPPALRWSSRASLRATAGRRTPLIAVVSRPPLFAQLKIVHFLSGQSGGLNAFVDVKLNDATLHSRLTPTAVKPSTLTVVLAPAAGVLRVGVNTLLITLHADAPPWSYLLSRVTLAPPNVVHVRPSDAEIAAIAARVHDGGYEFDSARWRPPPRAAADKGAAAGGFSGFRSGYQFTRDDVKFTHFSDLGGDR